MKSMILTAGKIAVASAVIFSGQAKASDFSTMPSEHSKVQKMVETFDEALTLGVTEEHGKHSELSRVAAEMKKLKEICAKIEATEEQKVTMRDDLFAFKEKTLPLETNLKIARLKYLHNALTANGLESEASARVADAVNAVTAIAQAKGELVTKILFQTLKPEQRKAALVCMAAMKLSGHDHDAEEHAID